MKIISFLKTSAVLTMALGTLSLTIGTAYAKHEWKENHPRRTEVNNRLKNENKRINQGVKNGTLTQSEAQQLRSQDKNIRQEERNMAANNGGHITKAEQKDLNQQENAASKQIYQEKHD